MLTERFIFLHLIVIHMFKHKVLRPSKYNIIHSQNYLSQKVAKNLVDIFDLDKSIPLIEIGAGKGSLTQFLQNKVQSIKAIELDQKNIKFLQLKFHNSKIQIVQYDFLKYNLPQEKYNIIGNIPFGKSAAIVRKLLNSDNPPISSYLIVQKEFAERLTGNDFFALQFKPWFEIKILKQIRRFEIDPVPRVGVVLIEIKKRSIPLVKDKNEFLDFVSYCFSTRKNSLQKVLNSIFTFKQLQIIKKEGSFDIYSTPRQLSIEQWIYMYRTFVKYVDVSKKTLIQGSYKKLENRQSKINKRTRTNIRYNW